MRRATVTLRGLGSGLAVRAKTIAQAVALGAGVELVSVVAVKDKPSDASLLSKARAFGRYDLRITVRSDDPARLMTFRIRMADAFKQLLATLESETD